MESQQEVKNSTDTDVRDEAVKKFVDYAINEEIKPPFNKVVVSEAFTAWWAFLSVTERIWGIKYEPETNSAQIVDKLRSSDSGEIFAEVVKELIKTAGADEFFAGIMTARGFRILGLASPVVATSVGELGDVDSEVVLLSDSDGVRLWGALRQRNENDEAETPGDLPT